MTLYVGTGAFVVSDDRYGGTYSGAEWIAYLQHEEDRLADVHGSDPACSDFWKSPLADRVGRGATALDALADLLARLGAA